ncbi:MAG: matrixin family metalloprotease [Longimicrobiales bacterium]
MVGNSRGQTSPLLLIALVAAGGLFLAQASAEETPEAVDPLCVGSPGCAPEGTLLDEPPSIDATSACGGTGYLCAQLEGSDEIRLYRWHGDRRALRVEIALPDHEDPARARKLQRAAVRGVQAWHGKPFELSIVDRSGAGTQAPDIMITWSAQLDGSALGVTRTRWETAPGGATFTSVGVTLATRSPYNREFSLTEPDVELVAAHEMGHALGLPHSNYAEDLMYPKNTAARLSARDYRTMEALYGLPNGVTITAAPDL